MSLMSMAETNETIKYGLLASQVSFTLKMLQIKQGLIDEKDKETLKQGLLLLDQVIDGSKFIKGENLKDSLHPSSDNITAFRYALSTLQFLKWVQKTQRASEVLNPIRDTLSGIIDQRTSEELETTVDKLREFFNALSSSFYNDIADSRQKESEITKLELKSQFEDEPSLATIS